VKYQKMPHLKQGGTQTKADEFLALLIELEGLNAARLKDFGVEMRRSHYPNKTS